MTCGERIIELVECARRQAEPDRDLLLHLSRCTGCRERWDAERRLTHHFRIMRTRVAALGSPDIRRESLMLNFSRKHRHKAVQSWVWALSAAAAIVLVIFSGYAFRGDTSGKRTHRVDAGKAVLYEASVFLSSDASALSSDDFIAVPYTPPLAPGEMVRMVHAEMYPEALASIGVEIDPAWAGDLPVDLVLGEDGLPRAVRISDNSQF